MNHLSPSIEEVDPALRDQVQQIVALCKVSTEQAYQTLLLNDFCLQSSMAALKPTRSASKLVNSELNHSFIEETSYSDSDEEYEPYYYYDLGDKKYFYEKYPVNVEYIKSRTQIEHYRRQVHQKLKEIIKDSFLPSNLVPTLEEALCVSYNDKIPILLLYSDFSPEVRTTLKELFANSDFTDRLDTQFIFFCMDTGYKLEDWLLFLQLHQNSLLILRTNVFDNVEVVSRVNLGSGSTAVLNELKKGKSVTMKRYLDDKYIKWKHKMTKEGKFWRRPTSFKGKQQKEKKLLSHRKLMKKQEQDYKEMVDQLKEQKNIQNKKQELEQNSKAEYQKQLERKKTEMKTYEEGLEFKVRVPSGANLYIKALPQEKVQYLFDVIECRQESLGFQIDAPRKFDLFIGLNCKDSLSESKEKRIGEVFDGPGFLVVRERE